MLIKPKKKFFTPSIVQFYGAGGGGGGGPVASYIGNANPGHTGAVWTKASVAIGNPAFISTRRVIWVVADNFAGRTIVTTAGATTINGIDATVHVQTTGSTAGGAILSAVVPSGTSVTFQLTMSANIFADGNWGIYIVDDSLLTSSTPQVGSAFDNTAVTSLATSAFTVSAGGFVVGGTNFVGGSAQSISTSGWTVDGSSFGLISGHNFAPGTGSQTMTGTSTGSPTGCAVTAATWR